MCMSRLSQRTRDQAFSPDSMSMTTGYFWGKKKGKQNLKNFLAVQFTTYYSRNSTNGHLSATSSFFLADSPYMDSYILGSLSNDDGDVNENGKKAIVLDCGQNNNFARAPRFFLYISLPSLHDSEVKMPNFTFCGEREHKATTCFVFFWTSIQSFRTQLQDLTNWMR